MFFAFVNINGVTATSSYCFPTGNSNPLYNSFFIILLQDEPDIAPFINALPEEYKNNFVYVKKDNKGLADTKNVGIAKARGEFISVVDSDDYIDKNFYKIAREYVKDNDIIRREHRPHLPDR